MKLKNLFAAALLLCSGTAMAQTDVTSTYLTNADFSESTALTSNLYGYGKDGTPYGFQTVDGWTSVVLNGDNSNKSYPNSGMAGGVFAYGSSTQLKGNNKAAPAAGPNGTETNCLGFFGVWGCGGYYYQSVTFPAGKYTITVPIYNQSGTQANTTYTGFFPTSGTNRTVAINTTVGSWTTQTVTFNLAAETEGQIRLGYLSTGSGSGANPHIFFDCVKIEYTAQVVKTVLETAITAATNANTVLGNSDLATAINTAQAVYDDEDATQDEVNAAATTLNNATELAMSAAGTVTGIFLSNPGFESCTETTTNAAAGSSAAPLDIAGDWTQVNSAAWSSSAVVSYGGAGQVNGVSAPAADNLGNGGYTLGVSVGWSGTVTYKSASSTWPAGAYTVTINGYNALKDVTQFKSQFGFIPTEGTSTMSTKTAFTYGAWETDQITFSLTEATEGYIQVGGTAISGGSGSNAKVFFDNITITYSSFLAAAKAAWDAAVTAATTAKTNYPNVKGTELTALNEELAKDEPTTVDGYNEATEALTTATETLVAAAPNYDALVAEIAYATTVGVSTTDAQAVADASTTTAATALEATQTLKVLEYTTLSASYDNDVTTLLGDWTSTFGSTSGQHWDASSTAYSDTWSASATPSATQTVTLPAGTYMFKVAGRGQSGASLSMSVKVGDADAVSTDMFCTGDTGLGINLNGVTSFDSEDEAGFANSNAGRGWQWRYIKFTTDGESEVVLTISGSVTAQWISFTAPYLLCDDDTYATVELIAAKAALQTAITDATAARKSANEGDAVFQIPASAGTTLASAISAAQDVYDNGTTAEAVNAATTTLNEAVAAYEATEINEPAEDQLFNVVLTYEGWDYDQKAMTYIAGGRTDAGLYNIQYKEAANTNLAQAFTFTKVSGNNYKLSQIDADGTARYICTGVPYSGNTAQIRTTTTAEDALEVTVIPTATEGVYNLYNTAASQYIGSQDAGVYTVNSHIDFNIIETSKASITINTSAAGWGTTILPFAVAELPEGVKAYSVDGLGDDNATLTLEEVTALVANTPYIIEGSWNETVSGDAQGTATSYVDGLLTGVYTTTAAPDESYILQKQDDVVGFYQVDTSVATPNVPANRAYLTAPAAGVKAFILNDVATAIKSVFDGAAAGEIYDIAGRKVSRMQKGGIYVINGKKVMVK